MKSQVTKFDLDSAFKELNLLDYPDPTNHCAKLHNSLHDGLTSLTEALYSVNDTNDLQQAKSDNDEAIAKAKLARIERIVDLDAQSEEDLLPSYVGKTIIQCPQCMTLFYKNAEDIEKSEDDTSIVNINEPCQHCGNISGYEIIGKVAADEPEESNSDDEQPAEEQDTADTDLNLEFSEPTTEVDPAGTGEAEVTGQEESESEESVSGDESSEEAPSEDNTELEPVEETDEENKNESYKPNIANALFEDVLVDVQLKDEQEVDTEELKADVENLVAENEYIDDESELTTIVRDVEELIDPTADDEQEEQDEQEVSEESNEVEVTDASEVAEEPLTESATKDLDALLDRHNQYIAYLQKLLQQDEEALERAKKMKDADEVVKALEKRIQADKEDLQAALPEAVKTEVATEELPTPEEVEVKNETVEEVTEACKDKKLKESTTTNLTEDSLDLNYSDAAVDDMLNSEEFTTPITDAEVGRYLETESLNLDNNQDEMVEKCSVKEEDFDIERLEDLHEESLNTAITSYLTEVYENVNNFSIKTCSLKDNKLFVEGIILFKSGTEKQTVFEFMNAKKTNTNIILEGYNSDFVNEKAFKLNAISEANCLITESIKYSYAIGENLVEGLAKAK